MEDWFKAGEITAEAREYGRKLIKPGVKLLEVSEKVEDKIIELGGRPAFPVQLSVNHIAAHYNPHVDDSSVFKEGDLVKLDLGVHVNGAVADTAVSVDLGDNQKLVKASRDALKVAIEIIKPGISVREIGKVIDDEISKIGFTSVKNLGGHGIKLYKVHTSPFVPNFDNNDNTKLEKGQVIALEPFATEGAGMVAEGAGSEVYELREIKPVRDRNARILLEHIKKEYNTLPFAKRWVKNFKGYNFALANLVQRGILHHFPQLPEKTGGLVSQHEHTVIVGEGVIT
jgi:methionyl aminopeptidase